jgi:hypothetical protein
MKQKRYYLWLLSLPLSLGSSLSAADPSAADIHSSAHDQYLEEIVVSGPFSRSAAETSQPVNLKMWPIP